VVKQVQVVQMILAFMRVRRRVGLASARLSVGALLLVAARPAGAATLQSVLEDAHALALDTGASVSAFVHRIVIGDMTAVTAAAFTASALIGFAGLWLVLRSPRDEAVLALPPPSPDMPEVPARRGRSMRLLDAVSVARTQFEIALAERERTERV